MRILKPSFIPVWILHLCIACNCGAQSPVALSERKDIKQGPDTVFDETVEEIIPALVNASETGRNGRIGREMVFWEYRLTSGEPAYFYACAPLKNTDCRQRRQLICEQDMRVIAELEMPGRVSRFRCPPSCHISSVEMFPCCSESVEEHILKTGLVQCQ